MTKSSSSTRTSTIHYHFQTQAFEFVFQWVLGMGTNGGSEVGGCFYAASQVKENDPESWVRAFISMAESVKNKAEASFKDGHLVSARECYLRAYTYDLSFTNLSGASLYQADLRDANLEGANLRGTDLTEADLRGTWLEGANLRGTIPRGVNSQPALIVQKRVSSRQRPSWPFCE